MSYNNTKNKKSVQIAQKRMSSRHQSHICTNINKTTLRR